jgi:hypothetical protein
MERIEIEKNIPAPTSLHPRQKYPFHEMDIGDSFWVASKSVRSAISSFVKHNKSDKVFVTRTERDGTRVWRIM